MKAQVGFGFYLGSRVCVCDSDPHAILVVCVPINSVFGFLKFAFHSSSEHENRTRFSRRRQRENEAKCHKCELNRPM